MTIFGMGIFSVGIFSGSFFCVAFLSAIFAFKSDFFIHFHIGFEYFDRSFTCKQKKTKIKKHHSVSKKSDITSSNVSGSLNPSVSGRRNANSPPARDDPPITTKGQGPCPLKLPCRKTIRNNKLHHFAVLKSPGKNRGYDSAYSSRH